MKKKVLRVNLSKREMSLLEEVCYTKLLTINDEAILEKDNDIYEVIKNITKTLLYLGKSNPLFEELKILMEKFTKIRDDLAS